MDSDSGAGATGRINLLKQHGAQRKIAVSAVGCSGHQCGMLMGCTRAGAAVPSPNTLS